VAKILNKRETSISWMVTWVWARTWAVAAVMDWITEVSPRMVPGKGERREKERRRGENSRKEED
jgi:hypothetical protein